MKIAAMRRKEEGSNEEKMKYEREERRDMREKRYEREVKGLN